MTSSVGTGLKSAKKLQTVVSKFSSEIVGLDGDTARDERAWPGWELRTKRHRFKAFVPAGRDPAGKSYRGGNTSGEMVPAELRPGGLVPHGA